MDVFSSLAHGFAVALTFQNIFLALIGCFLGTIIGALPGLGPSNGVAILIPLAFSLGLDATAALILLTSVYYGAMYGGRISSILLNIPGDEPALMTTLDGYPMARKGQAGEALSISGIASFVGAFFATWGLVFLAPQLVKVALLFGPAEYFALFALAFATLGGVSSTNQAKAAFAAALGLGIAMIGVDGQTGVPRFAFGEVHLYDGIDFLVAIVGLFALSEVLIFLEHRGDGSGEGKHAQVGMGVLVNPRFALERANGVAFTGNPSDLEDPRFTVNVQIGEVPVVGSTPGVVAELDRLLVQDGMLVSIDREVASSLVPAGTPVLDDARLRTLGELLWAVARDFPVDEVPPEGTQVMHDLELKITAEGELMLKQIRPFAARPYVPGEGRCN